MAPRRPQPPTMDSDMPPAWTSEDVRENQGAARLTPRPGS
ncbi:hypothetical protein HMPREF9056_00514 [Actinomyces sp. oral taxon 170 str. F0386]|nr:hypothetical protein HMPREF9056_00514 [Actinomyces sp. oral taxon 170 str. F0386]